MAGSARSACSQKLSVVQIQTFPRWNPAANRHYRVKNKKISQFTSYFFSTIFLKLLEYVALFPVEFLETHILLKRLDLYSLMSANSLRQALAIHLPTIIALCRNFLTSAPRDAYLANIYLEVMWLIHGVILQIVNLRSNLSYQHEYKVTQCANRRL